MTFRLRLLYAVCGVALIVAAAIAARQIPWQAGLAESQREHFSALTLHRGLLEATIARYQYLPLLLSQEPRVRALLNAPDNSEFVDDADRYLDSLNKRVGASALYIMDFSGQTLAASNYAEPGSFVGQSYLFRPYFADALTTGQGRFYGIGVTSGEPGYFLSHVIQDGGRAIGVAVVKVDLKQPLEKAWQDSGEDVTVVDRSGIAFLTSVKDRRYRPLRPLGPRERRELDASQQYGVNLGTQSLLEADDRLPTGGLVRIRSTDGSPQSPVLLCSLPLPDYGWTLIATSSVTPLTERANLVAAVTALTPAFLALVASIALPIKFMSASSAPTPFIRTAARTIIQEDRPSACDEAALTAARRLKFAQERTPGPEYFVSYAWGDASPEGKAREAIVNRLCAEAPTKGITIIRDKTAMTTGDSIYKFMLRLGQANRVFVILSDKYLKSPFCMCELFEVWRNCRNDDKELLHRIRVFTLPCAKIRTPVDRTLYAAHWREECGKLDALVKQYGYDILGERDAHQHRLMKKFASEIGDILWTVADTLKPRDFKEFVKYGFSDRPPDAP